MNNKSPWVQMPTMPDDEWLARVPSGNFVSLVKEGTFAEVEWPYDPPGPRHVCGRIGLRFDGGRRDTWMIRSNGQGINGTQCVMPVMGQVPDEPLILPPEHVKHILRRLDRLEEVVIWGRRPRPVTVVDAAVVDLRASSLTRVRERSRVSFSYQDDMEAAEDQIAREALDQASDEVMFEALERAKAEEH